MVVVRADLRLLGVNWQTAKKLYYCCGSKLRVWGVGDTVCCRARPQYVP